MDKEKTEKTIEIIELFISHINRTMAEFIDALPYLIRMNEELKEERDDRHNDKGQSDSSG